MTSRRAHSPLKNVRSWLIMCCKIPYNAAPMGPARNEVSREFRQRRDHLIAALRDPATFGTPVSEALARRRTTCRQIATRLTELENNCALTQPVSQLYDSYVHMHCNRLCPDQTVERRALGLLLRARDSIAHRPKLDAAVAAYTG